MTSVGWSPVDPERAAVSGHGNHLLAALPPVEREPLNRRMERRRAETGDQLYGPSERIQHVFFPVTSVVSLLTVLEDGKGIETATVGREGMVGLFVFLGDDRSPRGRAVVQMGGEILRLNVDAFRSAVEPGSKLESFLRDYTRVMLLHVSQSAACNAAHPVPERLARWLLQTCDRTGSTQIALTHEFLAEILGVRRASVTTALRALRAEGAVTVGRGAVGIADRQALEALACECYAFLQEQYGRIVPGES